VIRRIVRFPLTAAKTAWAFIHPSRTAGRIAWGRVAIAVQIIAAVIFVGYTLTKKSIRLPFSSEPYQVKVEFADAQGLDRLDEPAAAVAGTPLGSVTDVDYEHGQAVATLTFKEEVRGKLFADASVSVRPASALQNLLVNVDPGTPEAGPLPEDAAIPASRTTGYVTIDELTSVLDADTQAYVTILIEQARIALRGREGQIRRALGQVGELTDAALPLSEALAERRELLTELVGELETVVQTVGDRGQLLAEAIDAGNATLAVTAGREVELAEMTRDLGPVLEQTESALASARALAVPLIPALDQLIPAATPLAEGLAKMNDLLPRAESLTDRFEELARDGKHPLELMLEGTEGIKGRIREMIPVMGDLTALSRRLNSHRAGIAQTADTLSSAFSSQDSNGAYGPIQVRFEPIKPENFGSDLPISGQREHNFERAIAMALEATCVTENPLACIYRFSLPQLPEKPVLRDVPLADEVLSQLGGEG
jgi:virulence factor Mce-like protein